MQTQTSIGILPFLGSDQKILELLQREGYEYKESLFKASLDFLKFESSIWKVIKMSNFSYSFCLKATKFLKSVDKILEVLKRNDYSQSICDEAMSALRLMERSEDQILAIMIQSGLDSSVCKACAPFLKSVNNIITAMVSARDFETTKACVPLLKLEERTPVALYDILVKTKYRSVIFQAIAPLLKSKEKIWRIIGETDYEVAICIIGLPFLKSEKRVLEIMEKTKWNSDVCKAAVPFLDFSLMEDKQIMTIVHSSRYQTDLCLAAINSLRLDDNIVNIITGINSSNKDVFLAILPYLKSQEQILKLLKTVEYDETIFKKAEPLLKLEEKTERKLLDLAEKTNFKWQLAISVMSLPSLKSKKIIMRILRGARYYQEELSALAVDRLRLKEKTIKQILELMKEANFDKSFCLATMPFLVAKLGSDSREQQLALMERTNYNYNFCEAIAQSIDFKEMHYSDSGKYRILGFVKRTKYNIPVCREAVKYLKSRADIMSLLEKVNYDEGTCKNALPSLELKD
jgi:hypothetical protein